jgi:DNA-binding CsgD family transcriptional regulator
VAKLNRVSNLEMKEEIEDLIRNGYSLREILDETGCHRNTVRNIKKAMGIKSKLGRPRKK